MRIGHWNSNPVLKQITYNSSVHIEFERYTSPQLSIELTAVLMPATSLELMAREKFGDSQSGKSIMMAGSPRC